MIKTLTKIENLKAGSGAEYFKLHFGNQYFMVTPWHYTAAGMMPIFHKCPTLEEGKEYDIKWRSGKVKGADVTILTQLEEKVDEFCWVGEEEGSSETPQEAPKQSQPAYEQKPAYEAPKPTLSNTTSYTPLVSACHMCGKPFNVCNCEIPF